MEIDITKYITEEQIAEIVKDAVSNKVYDSTRHTDISTLLSNAAYDIVTNACKNSIGKNAEDIIKEKIDEIVSDPATIKYCLFRDPEKYGYHTNEMKGIGLQIAEKYLLESCKEKIEKLVDDVVKNIRFNTKKFENMVMKEAAKIVAEKITASK